MQCTGRNCPMQVGTVDPATCKCADVCEWATKPVTNGDCFRCMTDDQLAEWLDENAGCMGRDCPANKHCEDGLICKQAWLEWLREGVSE